MPRLARQVVDDSCDHILTRGNNRSPIFHEPADDQRYGQLHLESLPLRGLQLDHDCLMTNHVHVVVYAVTGTGLRGAMQRGDPALRVGLQTQGRPHGSFMAGPVQESPDR